MAATSSDRVLVIANDPAVDGVRLLTLAVAGPWPFREGQVAELALDPGTEGYFAIASAPREASASIIDDGGARLVFLVKAGDSDSEPLMRVRPGDLVSLRGPFGAGFEPPPGAHLLFVTAGTAIAAVRSAVVERLGRDDATPIDIVIGVRRLSDLCFAEELVAWRTRGVRVRVVVSNDPTASDDTARGRVQAHLIDLVTPDTHAFIAGSEELEDEVTRVLVAAGVDALRIQRNYRPDARTEARPPGASRSKWSRS